MLLEAKAKAISQKLAENSLADLPWQMIMEFIMSMVQNCFPSSSGFREAKRMGPAKQAALGVWIRSELGVRGWRRVNAVREVMLEELASTSEPEIDQVWLEAKQELQPVDFSVM